MCFKHDNVYMAGDAYAPKHWPAEFVRYVDTWGQDKCLFGTDWPVIDPERAMQEIDQLPIREASRAKFLCGNAERLFRLPEPPDANSPPASRAGPRHRQSRRDHRQPQPPDGATCRSQSRTGFAPPWAATPTRSLSARAARTHLPEHSSERIDRVANGVTHGIQLEPGDSAGSSCLAQHTRIRGNRLRSRRSGGSPRH